jgi:hypothetical protein
MDIIDEQVDAYNARDLERFVATYSPDIVIENGEGQLMMEGLPQIRAHYGILFEKNPELHARVVNRIRQGKYTVDEEEVTGVMGATAPIKGVVIYRVEGEKIVHVRLIT